VFVSSTLVVRDNVEKRQPVSLPCCQLNARGPSTIERLPGTRREESIHWFSFVPFVPFVVDL
jgi:hypothetical protein